MTSSEVVFERFLRDVLDFDFIQNNCPLQAKDLSGYLDYARGRFEYYSKTSLSLGTEYQGIIEFKDGNGVAQLFSFAEDLPALPNIQYDIRVDGVELDPTQYAVVGKDVTITTPPPTGQDNVMISWYVFPVFMEDLPNVVIMILSQLMIEDWISKYIYKSRLLNQKVYGKDFSEYSQSNHMRSVSQAKESLEKKNTRLIREYDMNVELYDKVMNIQNKYS